MRGAESRAEAPRPPSAVDAVAPPVLFRRTAVEAYLRGELVSVPLRAAGPASALTVVVVGLVLAAALVASVCVRVELSSVGPGVLRPARGVQALVAQVGGTVADVAAHSGEAVGAGAHILTLDAAPVRAARDQAVTDEALAAKALARLEDETSLVRRIAMLERRASLLRARIGSQSATAALLDARTESYATLERRGYVAKAQREDVGEDAARGKRDRLALEQQLSDTELEIAGLRAGRDDERYRARLALEAAAAKKQAADALFQQTDVRAPEGGFLEAVLARPGDVVAPGATLGRLVPTGPAERIVALLPERDRAFLTEGAIAKVEVEQLPAGEFGSLAARVVRIASATASEAEARDAAGDTASATGPAYRVELEPIHDARFERLSPYLRPGVLVRVRYTLRTQRLITLALAPLRRWLD
jgi:multidrug resistance efflux pump